MEGVRVDVIVVMTVENTDVTPRSLYTFPSNEPPLSSELKVALNIEAVRSVTRLYISTRLHGVTSQNTFFVHNG
jgi:hypothetical protein